MLDFTLETYNKLLQHAKKHTYKFFTFEDFLTAKPTGKTIILRHDVDKRPENAYKMARLENEYGIQASYYFRIVKKSRNPEIIKKIADFGHEIGYHYEDLSLAKGNYNFAINLFEKNLNYFRQFYPVKTICMHGSPLSKWNNKDIWNEIDYMDYGIIGEPFVDIEFQKVAYLTDTGRKWNALSENIRDKIETNFAFDFKSTYDVINAIKEKALPEKIMINTHPQRWTDQKIMWLYELAAQRMKNLFKKYIININIACRSNSTSIK